MLVLMIFAMVVIAVLTALVVGEARENGESGIFWGCLGVVLIVMTYFAFCE